MAVRTEVAPEACNSSPGNANLRIGIQAGQEKDSHFNPQRKYALRHISSVGKGRSGDGSSKARTGAVSDAGSTVSPEEQRGRLEGGCHHTQCFRNSAVGKIFTLFLIAAERNVSIHIKHVGSAGDVVEEVE
ncbi:MAG: hypothetical protein BWY07_02632 [Candidatus Hydrogenedentes bacterium ADurb.Bin170]|nr:MAG: hypothetical protein BWY07_02632 [Candidatus Hydrogenedentes bacterium ADurb.Bin170]